MSNWAGHTSIWDHFDEHASDSYEEEGNNQEEEEKGSKDGVIGTSNSFHDDKHSVAL